MSSIVFLGNFRIDLLYKVPKMTYREECISNTMKDSAMKRQTEQECNEMHCKNDK